MGLTRDEAILGYRYILGREPESEAVLESAMANHPSWAHFRGVLLESDEYRRNSTDFLTRLRDGYTAEPQRIDSSVSEATMARLFARIQGQWRKLGEEDPYWSVLTVDRYRLDRITQRWIDHFYASGKLGTDLIQLSAERTGYALPRGTCLELGCGVGRITRHLADRFDHVIGVDISEGNLAIGRQTLEAAGITNVEFRHVADMAGFADLPEFDAFFSVITLQHNPPPIQAHLLNTILGKLRPGGGILFQTVTDLPGYGFDAEAYLAGPDAQMEIHALPQATILNMLRLYGIAIQSIMMDPWLDAYGSHTFYGAKA
jgi:SAM-dependent methyltransferase